LGVAGILGVGYEHQVLFHIRDCRVETLNLRGKQGHIKVGPRIRNGVKFNGFEVQLKGLPVFFPLTQGVGLNDVFSLFSRHRRLDFQRAILGRLRFEESAPLVMLFFQRLPDNKEIIGKPLRVGQISLMKME